MIIVEGPDGAGKTNLVTRLENSLFEYGVVQGTHKGTPNRDRMWETTVERTYDALGRDLNPAHPPLLWDRMFYSELVYAPVMERPNAFGTTANYVHRLIAYTGSPVIFCMPPLETVQGNCMTTDQHSWVANNVEAIYRRYQQIIARYSNQNTYLWDYTDTNWTDLVRSMGVYLRKRKEIA